MAVVIFVVAVVVVGLAGFVLGAAAAHRRHYLPSYRERWQQACRVNEKQYEALEQAVNALEAEDAKERGQAVMAAREVMRARVNKDWDAKAKKSQLKRDMKAYLGPQRTWPRSLSTAELERVRKYYSP